METSISQEFDDAGQKLADSTGSIADMLNQTLNQLLTLPFRAAKGYIRDAEGQRTDIFGTLIFTASESQPKPEPSDFMADNIACVIEPYEILDIENLNAAYERIASAKRLKKTVVPDIPGVPQTTITLGIIFARDTAVPLETLAEELDHLNKLHPDREWTDMVVVLSKGTINYAVQFPGEKINGDYLPPAEGATKLTSPPIYLVILIRPTGHFTFNKMCSFLIAHLMIFLPGSKLLNWNQILEGVPTEAITLTGYQYNLSGNLMPVPPQFYSDRYIPPRPYLIEDQKGNVLSTMQFLPWQDGGVILLQGKLPLDGLLIFLGKKAFERGGTIRLNNRQLSYVLPITHEDFMQMLQRIQMQTNMIIKLDPTKFVVQKTGDEGTSSPFIARLFIGILSLRDAIFIDDTKRAIFDKQYNSVMEALSNMRSTSKKIVQLLSDHFSSLAKGEAGQVRGLTIQIEKTIDKELRKEVESFMNSAVRALKHGMQELTKVLNIKIDFLFKKQSTFENEVEKNDLLLSSYLKETRKWSEPLIEIRNDIEHGGWILPKIRYSEFSGVIRADEPEILSQKVSNYVTFIMDRLNCFVEEVTAHCLKARMPFGISVTEIPLSLRELKKPQRFQLTIINGGLPIWNLAYHQSSFEET